MGPRSLYVDAARRVGALAEQRGWLDALAARDHWFPQHLRTLPAIYDAVALAELDLPWWTYDAIDEVERFLSARPAARVFEFGSGASTVWLARRAAEVHSLEHDAEFAALVTDLVDRPDRVTLHVVPATPVTSGLPEVASERVDHTHLDFADYVATIDEVGGPFDLIVVDGRARVACLRRALPHLADDGMVVFDDVGRRRYRPAKDVPGYRTTVLSGAKPSLPYPSSTALLTRERR